MKYILKYINVMIEYKIIQKKEFLENYGFVESFFIFSGIYYISGGIHDSYSCD